MVYIKGASNVLLYSTDRQRKMSKLGLFLLLSSSVLLVTCFEGLLGTGQWLVLNFEDCEDPENYEIALHVTRRKLNRTHDSFNIIMSLDNGLNSTYGILIDIYKEMDGGFKYYQSMSDKCACDFLMRYAEVNVKRGFVMGKIDPPDCPIKEGTYEVKDFVMDYTEINDKGIYGTFKVNAYFVLAGEKVACLRILLIFEKHNS